MAKPQYSIRVASVVEDSVYPLQKSNRVTVFSSDFKPFGVFCYFKIHNRAARWPNKGCCSVSDMVSEEVLLRSKRAHAISLPGRLRQHRPHPNPVVFNVFQKTESELAPSTETLPGDRPTQISNKATFTILFFYSYWFEITPGLRSLLFFQSLGRHPTRASRKISPTAFPRRFARSCMELL